MKRLALLWIIGLVTLVPYGVYYLLFQAPRDEYAFLITFILFWIFNIKGVGDKSQLFPFVTDPFKFNTIYLAHKSK